jgi:hypothetical protein
MVFQLNHHITTVKNVTSKLVCINNIFSRKGTSFLQCCQNIQKAFIDLTFHLPYLTGLNSKGHDVSR